MRRYTPEQRAWLREHYPTMTNAELSEAFGERFGTSMSTTAVRAYGSNYGLRKEPDVRERALRTYTDEENEWLRGFIPGHTEGEIIDAFEERFGRRLKVCQVANRKVKLGVNSGTHGGQFKKGQAAYNKGKTWAEFMSPAGMEGSRRTQFKRGVLQSSAAERVRDLLDVRVADDGYRFIKVMQRDAAYPMRYWIPLGQFNWMQANVREWPEGHIAVHADRDITNDDADNIVPVSKDLYVLITGGMHGHGIEWRDRATLEVALTHAAVVQERRRLELDNHTCRRCGRKFMARYPRQRTCDACLEHGKD